MSTLETLQDILVAEFGLNRAELTPEVPLTKLGIDSLDVLELIFKIEDSFNLKIRDEVPTSWVTLSDVVDYIEQLRAQQAGMFESAPLGRRQ